MFSAGFRLPFSSQSRFKVLYDIICKREIELWKETKAQGFLQKAAESILKRKLNPIVPSGAGKIPPQIARHAILSDIPIANLKPEQSFLFDPIPPSEPILEYAPKVGRYQLYKHIQ